MVFIELVLIILYICVLIIKSCDVQGVQVRAEVTTIALQAALRATCSGFGFGDTASGAFRTEAHRSISAAVDYRRVPRYQGLVEFFVYFGLSLLALQPILLVQRYSSADWAPRVLLVALSHSVPLSEVIKKVVARR
jgi:hypothetical protein